MKRSEYIEILSSAAPHIPLLPLRQGPAGTWEPRPPAETARHVLAYAEAFHAEIERRRDDKPEDDAPGSEPADDVPEGLRRSAPGDIEELCR